MQTLRLLSKDQHKQTKYWTLALVCALIFSCIFLPACSKNSLTRRSSSGSTASSGSAGEASGEARPTDAKSAFDALMKGNERFVKGDFIARDLSSTKREELAKEQQPFAVVLACSDSRVAPELVFDQSLGDLYVVRVAGNVLDKAAIGSIEYAAEHLNTPLIFVLGHEKCGAVTAAVKNEGLEGNVIFLVNEIKPALARAKTMGGDLIAKTVDENVRNVVDTMPARSEILTKLIKENKVKIAGGTYNLTTGKINIVSELSAGAQAAAANEQ